MILTGWKCEDMHKKILYDRHIKTCNGAVQKSKAFGVHHKTSYRCLQGMFRVIFEKMMEAGLLKKDDDAIA